MREVQSQAISYTTGGAGHDRCQDDGGGSVDEAGGVEYGADWTRTPLWRI